MSQSPDVVATPDDKTTALLILDFAENKLMNVVKPVTFTTPDGVERQLRCTLGARRIIQDLFQMTLKEALDKYDSAAFPEVLWALMHDDKGAAPDVSIDQLKFSLAAEDSPEIFAAILAAMGNGKTEKNVIEASIRGAMARKLTGSSSGASQQGSSDSQTQSSGSDSSNAKSPLESTDLPSGSE